MLLIQEVQTEALLPSIFLVCKLIFMRRLVAILEWLTLYPMIACRPQVEQILAINFDFLNN